MSKIQFDEIHSQKKQSQLKAMMEQVNEEILQIENKNKVLKSCPICSSKKIKFFTNAFNFRLERCTKCTLIFCNPYPSDAQLNHYYSSAMKDFENEFFMETFEKRVELFKPRVKLIGQYFKRGSLLDIGAAIGVFAEAAIRYDLPMTFTCVDLSEQACISLKTKYPNLNVIHSNLFDLKEDEKFDVITMWDTIEHINDGSALIRKVSRLLKSGGVFIFSTPNTDSFEWKVAGTRHVQILPPGHVNLYNQSSIEKLLNNNNMVILDSLTMNPSLDISYVKKFVLENGMITEEAVGGYFWKLLNNDDLFIEMFSNYLQSTKQAGNIITVCTNK